MVLVLAMGCVMISPISDLDAAVHHHRSHHFSSFSLNAEAPPNLLVGSVPLRDSQKTVPERALPSRQPALLRC
jgi:hypothetical protein